jgi:hypothetical protein
MGYLGSHLEDYYSYQLLDEVSRQIDVGDTGDWDKLLNRLNRVVEKVILHNEHIKQKQEQSHVKA